MIIEKVLNMFNSFERSDKLEELTNSQLVTLALEKVWANMELFTEESDIVGEIISRLSEIHD